MHIHVIRWRQRLDCPERLGGDRWMRVILPAERLCQCALPYWVRCQRSEIRELHDADRRRQAVTSKMLKAYHRRSAEIEELRTADRDHLAGAGDSPTGTGGSITGTGHNTTGTGYRTTGTAGTRWRSCTPRAVRGGW
ncbi:hypothetical protein Tco_0641251 [Tanacetum coccineum]